MEDFTGRTPLHAAIAADALGVFQVGHLTEPFLSICLSLCLETLLTNAYLLRFY